MSDAELIERYWRSCDARDWDAFGAVLAEDVEYRIPQTGEFVRGRQDYVEFNRTFPGAWRVTIERIVADGGEAVSWTTFTIDGESMTGLCFFRIVDGLISEIDDFWPEPYEPPARATKGVGRLSR